MMIATSAAIGERVNQDFRKEQNKLNNNVQSQTRRHAPYPHMHSKLHTGTTIKMF